MSPDHPDFEKLPREEQVVIYRERGWTMSALMDEFDVSRTTIRRWLRPEIRQYHQEHMKHYRKTAQYKEVEKRYRSSATGKAALLAANNRYRKKQRLNSNAPPAVNHNGVQSVM